MPPVAKELPLTEVLYQLIVPEFVAVAVRFTAPEPQRVFPVAETTGTAFTVTVAVSVAVQPFVPVKVYVIVAVPAATPVTTPVEELTVATAVLEELHVPPDVAFDKVVVCPEQTVVVPVTGVEAVPVLDPTQLPDVPLNANPESVPLLDPLESMAVVTPELFEPAVPWLNL